MTDFFTDITRILLRYFQSPLLKLTSFEMKAAIFASVLAALGSSAAPLKRQASGAPTTTQVLQYALTLENLENNF